MKILALGDPHGYWRLAACLIRGWVDAHAGEWPDLILCPGDLGYFPDPGRVDRATRRHAEEDPEQLEGMRRLLEEGDPVVEALLPRGAFVPVDAVAGNHEDHGLLLQRAEGKEFRGENWIPLDPEGRVRMIRDGAVVEYRARDGASLRVAALWGTEPGANRRRPRQPGRHLDLERIERLKGESFDLLLTHEAASTDRIPVRFPPPEGRVGSSALRELLATRQGVLHLFGHYHHREGLRYPLGGNEAVLLSILRDGLPGMAVEIQGRRGAWRVERWRENSRWREAVEARLAEIRSPPFRLPSGR